MSSPNVRTVTVQVPLANSQTFTFHMQPGVTTLDIQREVESRLAADGVSLPEGEYGIFETAEKLILNASPPIAPNTLLLTLEQVSTVFSSEFVYARLPSLTESSCRMNLPLIEQKSPLLSN